MTSNLGAKEIARNRSVGFAACDDEIGESHEEMRKRVQAELKRALRPELLNRIDEIIVFHKLAREQVRRIVDLLLARVRAQLAEHEIQLELTEQAKDILVDKGFDPAMGARPLRRAIQRYVEDPLADAVLAREEQGPAHVVVDAGDPDSGEPLAFELKEKGAQAAEQEPVAA